MSTQRQIAANRRNALKSTGPKTITGKAIASRNATNHGFYSTSVVTRGEERRVYLAFARRFVAAYNPRGALQESEVKTIIETRWQLERVNLVDSELFSIYSFYENEQHGVGTAFAQDCSQGNAFAKLTRYHGFLLRKLRDAEKELRRLKAEASQNQQNSFHALPQEDDQLKAISPAELPITKPALSSSTVSEADKTPSDDEILNATEPKHSVTKSDQNDNI